MKKVAIVQSCYIPWKGYFDLIAHVDEFIFLDDAQFTRRDWRNRNQIKSSTGPHWLTIPVKTKGKFEAPISEIECAGLEWAEKHWKSLVHSYSKAPHFKALEDWVRDLYGSVTTTKLSLINRHFISAICSRLGIDSKLSWSTDYGPSKLSRGERILELCLSCGAGLYLSGPSAAAYLEPGKFRAHGIDIEYADYSGYPEYHQLYPPFTHNVSILDLLFATGDDAVNYLKGKAR